MLTEQRFERILERLKVKKSITVAEITEDLGISESTARRDITALDKAGKLTKVFGGAVAAEHTYEMKEPTVAQKVNVRKEEKIKIAQYAADMIGDNDFVYLDAGTSVGYMVEFLAEKRAAFVTNAVAHAQRLAAQGNRVLLIGGELKSSTEAVVGAQAIELLRKISFHKRIFRNKRYYERGRVYDSGRRRSAGETNGGTTVSKVVYSCRQYKVRQYKRRDVCSLFRQCDTDGRNSRRI